MSMNQKKETILMNDKTQQLFTRQTNCQPGRTRRSSNALNCVCIAIAITNQNKIQTDTLTFTCVLFLSLTLLAQTIVAYISVLCTAAQISMIEAVKNK